MLSLIPLFVVVLQLLNNVAAAPTKIGSMLNTHGDQGCMFAHNICSGKKCLFGRSYFDRETLSCTCPDAPVKLVSPSLIDSEAMLKLPSDTASMR